MTKLEKLVLWIIRAYCFWQLRNKRIFVISGLRRSGNHACIDWLTNAITGTTTSLTRKGDKIFSSNHGNIVHLNEVNFVSPFALARLVQHATPYLAQANTVLISLEDDLSSEGDIYTPKGSAQIYVKRRTLDLVASRIHYNRKRAEDGIDRGDMMVDQKFLDLQRRLLSLSDSNCFVWSYEDWSADAGWRTTFLSKLDLEHDIRPEVGAHGGGSSFVGQDKIALTKLDRQSVLKNISWPERVVSLLRDNEDLLNERELVFLNELNKY